MPQPQSPWFSRSIAALLLLVTVALYWPALAHDFVHFDDTRYVVENRHVHAGLEPRTVAWAFTTDYMATWHPLTWLSHAADWELYGADASGHHRTNVLLHTLNVLLLFGLLRRMTGRIWPSAFVALVFAVHPLNVATVAWVASRKGVLSMAFWLLTSWAYFGYTRRGGVGRYLLVIAAFAFGLLSKPVLVTLPLVLLLLDVWPLRRLRWNGATDGDVRPVVEKLPLFMMVAAVSPVIFAVRAVADPVPWIERVAYAPVAYSLYLRRIIWPTGLATPYPPFVTPTVMQVAFAIILLGAVSTLAIRYRRDKPFLAVGWLWFLITLAPVIGIVKIGANPTTDRWTYVPSIGIFIMAAWGIPSFLPRTRLSKSVLAGAAAVAIGALMIVTHAQIGYWRNTETLFRRALNVTENNRTAHFNLAWYLARQDKPDEAAHQYREAIAITPDHFPSHHNLALLLVEQGPTDEAIDAVCAAIELSDPSDEALRERLAEHLQGAECPEPPP